MKSADQAEFFYSAIENMVKNAQTYLWEKIQCFLSRVKSLQYIQQKNLLDYQRKTLPVFSKFQLDQPDTYNNILPIR
jgi:hypothetical protein